MTAPTGRAALADAITDQTTLDLLLQTGSVLAVNADGTLSVDLAGATLTLPKLNSYNAIVGDVVTVINAGGKRLVMGRAGGYRGDGGGILARTRRTTPVGPTTTTTKTSALAVQEVAATLVAGRLYRIRAANFAAYSPEVGHAAAQITYTSAASGTPAAPTAANTALSWAQTPTPTGNVVTSLPVEVLYAPATDQNARFLVSLWGGGGIAGSYTAYAATDWPVDLTVEDLGANPA